MTDARPNTLQDLPEEHRRKGPAIGERFPDVRLPDQTGSIVDLQGARTNRPALVVFYRSAKW